MIINQNRETPSLGNFAYQAQRFIDTGSKMSDILLAVDQKNRPVVLKIACVDQRTRAEANRTAIRNTIEWLQRLGGHRGMIGLRAIERSDVPWWQARFGQRIYCAVLEHWPGQPEFLVMDYLAGGSLRDLVERNQLRVELALWIAHHVAQTLAYLHHRGCVHRDLKPENILFRTPPDANGHLSSAMPILIDFGVAARTGEERMVSGSRLWMAPELQEAYERRPLAVDPAWDVYALGLILCYMIGGRRPRPNRYDLASYEHFREQTFAEIDSEPAGSAAAAPAVRMRLKELISRAMARTPAERISAEQFAEESARLLAEMGAPPGLREPLLGRMVQQRRLPAGRGKLVGAAALLGLFLLIPVFAGWGLPFSGLVMPGGDRPVHAAATSHNAGAESSLAQMSTANTSSNLFAAGQRVDETPTASISTSPTSPGVATTTPPTLPPEPTRAPFTPAVTNAAPTRIAWTPPAPAPAPTRIAWTPPATDPPPTLAAPSPTATAPPTATPRAQPTNTARPTATPPPTATPTATVDPAGRVQLLAPESGVSSSQTKVEFRWQMMAQQALADDHCFELVFWDPANAADKRSPVGAGKDATVRVDFGLLANSPDPVLGKVARTEQEFRWGVRLVLCASPRTVVREVEEERVYTYDGQ